MRCYDALQLAHQVHNGQMRRDGQPFVTHPVAVANLVASWGMDSECVVAALLHDAVEDTPLTFTEVESCFGGEVRTLVQGVTTFSKLDAGKINEVGDDPKAQTSACDDMLRLFDACAGDWRVAVLKVADRLHNMRTLDAMAPHKRARKAQETERVFVPLAHYLGAHEVGKELAELSAQHRADDQPQHLVWADRLSRVVMAGLAAAVAGPPAHARNALSALGWPGRGGGRAPAFAGAQGSAGLDDGSKRDFFRMVHQLSEEDSTRAATLYYSLRPLHERFTRHQAVMMGAAGDDEVSAEVTEQHEQQS